MARKSLPKHTLGVSLALIALVLFWGQAGFSQSVNGAFHGVVTDSSGAVLPGATVSVLNAATKVARQTATNDVGFYTVLQLPPGRYTVTATRQGFSTAERDDVQLLVDQDLAVDLTLSVGAVSQKVEVTGTPTGLETASATVAQVVGSQATVQLPLNGRQFTQLILLTPGAAPKENSQQSSNFVPIGVGGITPAVDGQRPAQNNFTLDGGLNNYLQNNGWIISPPPDAIQEFKVQSHMVDAQFGISSGANVNVVTRSGSDHLHGDAWEFLRNDVFDAANFFTNLVVPHQNKPPFRMNQYGVTLGGPVVLPGYNGREKKTYFFGYWEGFRSHQGFTEFASVPPAANLTGDFSGILTTTKLNTDALGRPIYSGQIFNPYSTRTVTAGQTDPTTGLVATNTGLVRDPFSGNIIPQAMLNGPALTYLGAFYEKPNGTYGTGGFPNYAGSSLQVVTQDQFGTRLDHAFSNNDNLTGAFYFRNSVNISPVALLLGAGYHTNDGRLANVNYTHIISPTFLVTVHYEYLYAFFTGQSYQVAGLNVLNAAHLANFLPVNYNEATVPAVTLSPRITGNTQGYVLNAPDHTHLLTADLQKIKGSHTLSAGAFFYHLHTWNIATSATINFNQVPSGGIAANGANVTSGDGLASMLLDVPNSFSGQFGNTTADLSGLWQSYYLQDKWQLSKKLNVQFGTRWDYVAPMHWANNQVSGFSLQCGCFLVSQPVPPQFPFANVRSTFFDPNYHGFEPRLGIAYTLTPKTVIRTGFAIIDDHGNNLKQGTQALRIKWPWGASVNEAGYNVGTPNLFFDNMPSGNSFYGPGSAVVSGFGADFHKGIPYSMEWNFGVQREITTNLTAEVDYVGSGSRHQDIYATANTPLPNLMGAGAIAPKTPYYAQYPSLGQISYNMNEGTADYNGLEAKLERRFSAGVTFLASYTWSHCLDIQGGVAAGSPETIYNIERDYGSCDFNYPQLFSFSTVYQLPFGKGKQFGSNWGGALNAVAGGWQAGGILTLDSGSPFSVSVSGDPANVDGGTERANIVGNPLPSGFNQTVQQWFNKSAYATPAQYTFGNLGRNTLLGPSYKEFDFSLMKDFHFTEAKYLQFRCDLFNLFNNVNLGTPNGTQNSSTFMQITSTSGSARDVQFSLKLVW